MYAIKTSDEAQSLAGLEMWAGARWGVTPQASGIRAGQWDQGWGGVHFV